MDFTQCNIPLVLQKNGEKVGKKSWKKSFGPLCMWTDVSLRTPGRKNRVAKCTL